LPDPLTVEQTARRLQLDAAAVEAVSALTVAGTDPVILKGVSFERLLYDPSELRPQLDVDILVDPDAAESAEVCLRALGYTPVGRPADIVPPNRSQLSFVHAYTWTRPDGANVDLHTGLLGVRVPPKPAFVRLTSEKSIVDLGWAILPCLSEAARALHVAFHAAQHVMDSPRTREEVDRAVALLSRATWLQALELAGDLDAVDSLAFGLRQTTAGSDLAAELGLPASTSPLTVIIAHDAFRPGAVALERLFTLTGFWPKARLALREAIPSPAYMRYSQPETVGRRLGLTRAYAARLRRLPRVLVGALEAVVRGHVEAHRAHPR
jgi:hypothetical protein